MKRRAGIAFLLAAIIFSSSLLFAETYLYSPLQNKWTGGVSGDVLSSQIANGSLYVLTAHITNFNGNSYYYTAYRFNLSTGIFGGGEYGNRHPVPDYEPHNYWNDPYPEHPSPANGVELPSGKYVMQ